MGLPVKVSDRCDGMVTLSTLREHSYMWIRMARWKKVEDLFRKIKVVKERYEKVGLGADFVN